MCAILVLTVKKNESIYINGEEIIVTVTAIQGGSVKLGVEAARNIPVRRQELHEKEKTNDGHQ